MRFLRLLLVLTATTAWAGERGNAPVRGDLDGDGHVDLLLREFLSNSGLHTVWFMQGPTRVGTGAFSPALFAPGGDTDSPPTLPFWIYCGSGDFDGDGRNDAVFSQEGVVPTGAEIWLLDPGLVRRQAVPLASPVGCKSVNDFDGDGDPDILFYKANPAPGPLTILLMQGTSQVGTLTPQPSSAPGSNWLLIGSDDANGDGLPDLYWYNQTSRRVVQWLMGPSMVRLAGRFINPPADGTWQAVAVGDFGAGVGGPTGIGDIVAYGGEPTDRTCCRLRLWTLDADGNRIGDVGMGVPTGASWISPVGPR